LCRAHFCRACCPCCEQVSADGEQLLYEAIVRAGITMLSIGHRPALKQYHSTIVHCECDR
jgi:ABC-type uncharacterized transport system fused permease/ATPase subunit